MKFRFPMPGLAILLVMGLALGSAATMAEDGKGQGGDHSQTSGGDQGDGHQGSNDGASSDSGSGDHSDGHQGSDDSASSDDGGGDSVGDNKSHEANETPEKEQEEARQAVASGRAAPLSLLLKKLKTDYPGQILDVALIKDATKLKFVVKYIDKASRVKTVTLNALTLEDD